MANVRYCTLFSGSSANCTYIEADGISILIDVGAGVRKLGAELDKIGSCYAKIKGIFLTHEHSDHIAGLPTVLRKYKIPVFANENTLCAVLRSCPDVDRNLFHVMKTGATACNGPFTVRSFATSHDSAESVGYIVDAGGVRLGLMTDTGIVTEDMMKEIDGCEALVLESNHDRDLLRTGPYPYQLKQRIAGQKGHLSNAQCVGVLCGLKKPPKTVLLAHLSLENNTPAIALDTAVKKAPEGVRILLAPRDEHSEVLEFGEKKCLV